MSAAVLAGGAKRLALPQPEVGAGSLCQKLGPSGAERPWSVPPALHPTKAISSLEGPGVSGCSLKSDLPAAGPEVLGHPRGCMGPGQCPPLPPAHHCLAPLHPLPTGPLPQSRPSNFSILCLRKDGSTVTPLPQLVTPSSKQAQANPGSLCRQRSALGARPHGTEHPEPGLRVHPWHLMGHPCFPEVTAQQNSVEGAPCCRQHGIAGGSRRTNF